MIARLALACLALAGAAAAQDLPALYDVTGVAADDVLNIRATPEASAPIVGQLAPDAKGVEVVGVEDGWAIVNHSDGSGYAAMAYLAHSGAADWSALGTPLHCFGTEPFWSLAYDPAARQVRFDRFEGEPQVMAVENIWGAVPMSDLVALGLDSGTAVMRPRQCSDGMSDFTYGIALDLFLTGQDGSAFYGCCSLTPR